MKLGPTQTRPGVHPNLSRGHALRFEEFYLRIPEVAALFPCISSWLPLTGGLGAHFHAISAQTRRAEVREGQINQRKWQLLSFLLKAAAVRGHQTAQKSDTFRVHGGEEAKHARGCEESGRPAPAAPNITKPGA